MTQQLSGYKFPLELSVSGQLMLASDEDYILGLIRSYVQVYRGERLGLPNYGIPDYLLKAESAFGLVASDLQSRLSASIPNAEFAVRTILTDTGDATVLVSWRYRGREQTLRFLIES